MSKKILAYFFVLFFSVVSLNSYAGIVLSGTRLIFDGNKTETTINVNNPDKMAYLIQSWVSLDNKKVPFFIVTPPLFRIDGNSSNVLRVVLTKYNLPQDRESLFWLNVKAIPPSDPEGKDVLLIALNTKIKLFYRPASLVNQNASTAYQKVNFKINKNTRELVASNPTPYYINLASVTYNDTHIENPGVIAPFSETKWKVKSIGNNSKVQWSIINDFGGVIQALAQKVD